MKKHVILLAVLSFGLGPLAFADRSEGTGAGEITVATRIPASANACPFSNYAKPEMNNEVASGKTVKGPSSAGAVN